ncbi:Cation-chloride cotransporter 1 [Acorus calamus]|uniref:Cation-chloride cotransporter 1 n=1 Tax=Acorus calamus TaxID=4465 RepID=A0AAV9D431_ACOCL|nr:Cation-chloride cotransporter 1 [Acorus calamus]
MSLELLLAIIESQDGGPVLPFLIKLGLENHFVRLLTSELSKIREERSFDGCPVLDLTLHVIEALSIIDTYSQVISSNEELIQLVCSVIKLRDKVEVGAADYIAVANNYHTVFISDIPVMSMRIGDKARREPHPDPLHLPSTFVGIINDCIVANKTVVIIKGLDEWPWECQRQYRTIDLYWIVRDGGLMLLLSQLLLTNENFET